MDIYLSRQVAMRLLEKDIHDKQDTLISLRRQLEDVKKLNLELHNKLQVLQAAAYIACSWSDFKEGYVLRIAVLGQFCAKVITHRDGGARGAEAPPPHPTPATFLEENCFG